MTKPIEDICKLFSTRNIDHEWLSCQMKMPHFALVMDYASWSHTKFFSLTPKKCVYFPVSYIGQLSSSLKRPAHLVAVIARPPRGPFQNERGHKLQLALQDPSCSSADACRTELLLHVFVRRLDELPADLGVGRVVLVSGVKLELWRGQLDGRVFSGAQVCPHSGATERSASTPVGDACARWVRWVQAWWTAVQRATPVSASAVTASHTLPLHPSAAPSSEPFQRSAAPSTKRVQIKSIYGSGLYCVDCALTRVHVTSPTRTHSGAVKSSALALIRICDGTRANMQMSDLVLSESQFSAEVCREFQPTAWIMVVRVEDAACVAALSRYPRRASPGDLPCVRLVGLRVEDALANEDTFSFRLLLSMVSADRPRIEPLSAGSIDAKTVLRRVEQACSSDTLLFNLVTSASETAGIDQVKRLGSVDSADSSSDETDSSASSSTSSPIVVDLTSEDPGDVEHGSIRSVLVSSSSSPPVSDTGRLSSSAEVVCVSETICSEASSLSSGGSVTRLRSSLVPSHGISKMPCVSLSDSSYRSSVCDLRSIVVNEQGSDRCSVRPSSSASSSTFFSPDPLFSSESVPDKIPSPPVATKSLSRVRLVPYSQSQSQSQGGGDDLASAPSSAGTLESREFSEIASQYRRERTNAECVAGSSGCRTDDPANSHAGGCQRAAQMSPSTRESCRARKRSVCHFFRPPSIPGGVRLVDKDSDAVRRREARKAHMMARMRRPTVCSRVWQVDLRPLAYISRVSCPAPVQPLCPVEQTTPHRPYRVQCRIICPALRQLRASHMRTRCCHCHTVKVGAIAAANSCCSLCAGRVRLEINLPLLLVSMATGGDAVTAHARLNGRCAERFFGMRCRFKGVERFQCHVREVMTALVASDSVDLMIVSTGHHYLVLETRTLEVFA